MGASGRQRFRYSAALLAAPVCAPIVAVGWDVGGVCLRPRRNTMRGFYGRLTGKRCVHFGAGVRCCCYLSASSDPCLIKMPEILKLGSSLVFFFFLSGAFSNQIRQFSVSVRMKGWLAWRRTMSGVSRARISQQLLITQSSSEYESVAVTGGCVRAERAMRKSSERHLEEGSLEPLAVTERRSRICVGGDGALTWDLGEIPVRMAANIGVSPIARDLLNAQSVCMALVIYQPRLWTVTDRLSVFVLASVALAVRCWSNWKRPPGPE